MEKNVLIAPIGTEPQIVTITLELLKKQRIRISEVIALHSVGEKALTAAADRLKEALSQIPDLTYEVKPFEKGKKQVTLLDSEREIDILFFCLYNEVRKQKLEGNTVYLLCSGGRKVAAAYDMLTAVLLFDDQDRLLSLISSGEFLESKKLVPETNSEYNQAKLISLYYLSLRTILPSAGEILKIDNPHKALQKIETLRLELRYREAMEFIESNCSRAERRILEVAAKEGLTNAQIAQKLFLSERTVESHMRLLLRKAETFWNIEDMTRTKLALLVQPYYQMKIDQ